ncbi:NACHT domain-containing protein [Nocardia sp. NPDC050406]|uniref:NACHT domain-containing protein n=1 Tax=Nocardia sp. NPDC050406 TaxID=3364318 RepID=UPI0037A968AD
MTGGGETIALKVGASLVGPAGRTAWRKLRPDCSPQGLARAANDLAYAVRQSEACLRNQLRSGAGIAIGLQLRELGPATGEPQSGVALDSFEQTYQEGSTPRRLLVLGQPGAGKTVTANQLVLDLLARRATLTDPIRAETPVPVRVSPSGWDGKRAFSAWLAEQLTSEYQVAPRVADALVSNGHILPVLDGLDEMDPEDGEPTRACDALKLLSTTAPWSSRPLILTCRANDFHRIRECGAFPLVDAKIYVLQSLDSSDIWLELENYRERHGLPTDAWTPVLNQITTNPEGPLARALGSPLMLGMAAAFLRTGGTDASLALTTAQDLTEIEDLLLGSLIVVAIGGIDETSRGRSYDVHATRVWLGNIAQHLEREQLAGQGFTLDQIWRIAGTRKCLTVHALLATLAVGGALAVLDTSIGVDWSIAATTALIFATMAMLAYGIDTRSQIHTPGFRGAPERFAWKVPGHSRWRRGLRGAVIVCGASLVTFALITGAAWLLAPATSVQVVASLYLLFVSIAVAFGIISGLLVGFTTTFEERVALGQNARRPIRDGQLTALLAGLTAFFLFGGAGTVAATLVPGNQNHVVRIGIHCGVWMAFAVWFVVGFTGQRYLAAMLIFKVTGIYASRPAQFCDWACRAGILRVNVANYQFRHATFQRWLANEHSTMNR